MSTTFFDRLRLGVYRLRYFIPAALIFLVSARITNPSVLGLLLVADALTMAAVCQAVGFDLESNFVRTILRRGAAYFALLVGYTAVVACLIGYPLLWVLRDGSLAATLALSTAAVVSLLSLWRLWPAFGLVLVWDDAYPEDSQRSWIFAAAVRGLTFARHLTAENELFFSHGLTVALCLLLLVQGALSLAGLCGLLPNELHVAALAIYAALIAPLAHVLIVKRTLSALLTERKRMRRDRITAIGDNADPSHARPEPVTLPGGLTPVEVNGMLYRCARANQFELALAALGGVRTPTPFPTLANATNVPCWC